MNPYGGCEHGCVYCYAPEVTHRPWDGWRVVRVKYDIAERLAKELHGLTGTIGIGTVTDPYQGAEARFMLTRRCLEVIEKRGNPVRLHTKSPLVLRDLDILRSIPSRVEITVTGTDRRNSLITEPGAPLPEERLRALGTLVGEGIEAYALIEPVLAHLEGREEELCDAVAATGVGTVLLGGLNGRPGLTARLTRMGLRGSPAAAVRIRDGMERRGITVRDAIRSRAKRISAAVMNIIYL